MLSHTLKSFTNNKIFGWIRGNLWFAPVFVGLILRLDKLTYSSIWHDEGYTMWLLRFSPLEIIARDARDVHPPGYYLIAKIWVTFFESSEFSIRFLSLLFSVGIIYLTFLIVKRIFSERAAFWSSLFVAFSPFMIRFGQEARMYGVVAFFTTLATYFLVRFIQEKKSKILIWYAFSMVLAIYNQYYAFFVVISHWLILAVATPNFFRLKWEDSFKKKLAIFNPWWWVANFSIVIAYLPWFPVAFRQVTRVSGSYWIRPEWITARTVPSNILQFLTYTHFDEIYNKGFWGQGIYWLIVFLLVFSGLVLWKFKEKRTAVIAVYIFGLLPMILVYALSELKTPVYQDRYFPFSAIGLFVLWGAVVAEIKNKWARYFLGAIFIVLMIFGNFAMRYNVNHKMRQLANTVKLNNVQNNLVLSGELYTFLDGAYYFGYDNIKLLSERFEGYGEPSLFYDKQDYYLVGPKEKSKLPNTFWLIGKSGKNYFNEENWQGWRSVVYFDEAGLKAVLYTR